MALGDIRLKIEFVRKVAKTQLSMSTFDLIANPDIFYWSHESWSLTDRLLVLPRQNGNISSSTVTLSRFFKFFKDISLPRFFAFSFVVVPLFLAFSTATNICLCQSITVILILYCTHDFNFHSSYNIENNQFFRLQNLSFCTFFQQFSSNFQDMF